MKVFIATTNFYQAVSQLFHGYGWEITKNIKDAHLVQFTGGEDINPALYGAKKHSATKYNPQRDTEELIIYEEALKRNIPIAGICRGAQLINALNGGRMWQHVNGHNSGKHPVKDLITGEIWGSTSIHHQMMIVHDDGMTLAEAYEATIKETIEQDGLPHSIHYQNKKANSGDPEVIMYWPKGIPALCFQGHPEFDAQGSTGKAYRRYLDEYVFEGKATFKEVA